MTRRSRQVLRYTFVSLLVTAVAAAVAVVATRKEADPVVPGDRSVEGLTDVLARNVPADAPRIVFRDVAAEAGVAADNFGATRSRVLPEDMASGCALFDMDGDGDLDLFVVGMEPLDPARKRPGAARGHRLFRNDGKGRFTDISRAAGVDTPVFGQGVAAGDYDGDGHLDLLVTGFGRNQLFRNRGDGTFEEAAERAGVAEAVYSTGAAWADYDRDGDLDLYVTEYVRFVDDPALRGRVSTQYGLQLPFSINPSSYSSLPNRLYRNRGDGTFEDVTAKAGVANPAGKGLSVVFTDLDDDGWPDLYVANDVSDNVFYRNRGDGTFEDVSHASLTADYRGAMGIGVGDYDGDGDLDLFVTHWLAQENALYENLAGSDPEAKGPLYTDVADQQGVGYIALDFVGWGTSFFDYDLDGRLDLLAVNGNTLEVPEDTTLLQTQRPLLLWNGGERGYFDVGPVSGDIFRGTYSARGAAFGDIDGDGDEDVYVVVLGGPGLLLRNEQRTGRHWLVVRPRQEGMNRFAVGAKVLLTAGGRTQVRRVGAQASYLSANSLDLHFGLGEAARVERLEVVFPDGSRRVLTDLEADRVVGVDGGSGVPGK